ncbi:LutC/YkgG family protein [Pedobacter sp. JCM 36344]|uniref:LutC/YkgG family protein n=1 Tax=Pedobacter sp. JCM 36344 TaxID=3374280 RepID=UPI00397870BB
MMTSRERILNLVKANQPDFLELPEIFPSWKTESSLTESFSAILKTIGGTIVPLNNLEEVALYISAQFGEKFRIISMLPELADVTESDWKNKDPHKYENVDLAIISAHFGVAENAAVWITEELMHQRAVPFICQQLAVVVSAKTLVPTMHHAYDLIGEADYGFGTFIAGPSKTADIEQSLVLGAHGPKSMIAFLLP